MASFATQPDGDLAALFVDYEAGGSGDGRAVPGKADRAGSAVFALTSFTVDSPRDNLFHFSLQNVAGT